MNRSSSVVKKDDDNDDLFGHLELVNDSKGMQKRRTLKQLGTVESIDEPNKQV